MADLSNVLKLVVVYRLDANAIAVFTDLVLSFVVDCNASSVWSCCTLPSVIQPHIFWLCINVGVVFQHAILYLWSAIITGITVLGHLTRFYHLPVGSVKVSALAWIRVYLQWLAWLVKGLLRLARLTLIHLLLILEAWKRYESALALISGISWHLLVCNILKGRHIALIIAECSYFLRIHLEILILLMIILRNLLAYPCQTVCSRDLWCRLIFKMTFSLMISMLGKFTFEFFSMVTCVCVKWIVLLWLIAVEIIDCEWYCGICKLDLVLVFWHMLCFAAWTLVNISRQRSLRQGNGTLLRMLSILILNIYAIWLRIWREFGAI